MAKSRKTWWPFLAGALALVTSQGVTPQSPGNYGSLRGRVLDPSNALISTASVTVQNQATGVGRTFSSDSRGAFQLNAIPFGAYRVMVSAPGFQDAVKAVSIRSPTPAVVDITLAIAGASASVQVSAVASGTPEASPTAHRVLDQSLLDHLPVQNQATGMSEMVTRTTPGVAADGNGFAHPLGEHADTSISLDNQPITDQQAKIFSNQISTSIIQTMEVVTGAPPAEYGDKTSLIINVTTQSGLGRSKPFGSLSSQYGSFGTWAAGVTFGAG